LTRALQARLRSGCCTLTLSAQNPKTFSAVYLWRGANDGRWVPVACCLSRASKRIFIFTIHTTDSPYFPLGIHLSGQVRTSHSQSPLLLILELRQKILRILPPFRSLLFNTALPPCASSGSFSSAPPPVQSVAAARSSAFHRRKARNASPRTERQQKSRTIPLC